LWALFHPGPSLATVSVAALCAVLLPVTQDIRALVTLILALLLQQAAVSVHNDWCDRALDAQAKPWRAIPAGVVSPPFAFSLWLALTITSFAIALALGWAVLALDAAFLLSAVVYSAKLKRTRWSWLPFATGFPAVVLYGCGLYDYWPAGWWSAYLVGAPLALAVHLADTLPDLETDSAAGVHGLTHGLGGTTTRWVASAAVLMPALAITLLGAQRHVPLAQIGGTLGSAGAIIGLALPSLARGTWTGAAAIVSLAWAATVLR
jgi:4-hydroxybenzoate polyprenyltransferase